MSTPTVSVVVLNYNGLHHLKGCLDALAAQTFGGFETILVDNDSSDGSADFVREGYPGVRVIEAGANLGFAAGNNLGFAHARGELIITLNNDTRAEPEWLRRLIAPALRDSGVGTCASKMVYMDAPGIIDSAGISVDRAGMAWNLLNGEPDAPDEETEREVFGPCAGAALYRREMLGQIGGFDEDYFIYHEDVDIAWRAQLAGWRCIYVPSARVHHAHSATAGDSALKVFYISRNKIWNAVKNYPAPQVFYYLPLIAGYDLAALAYRTARGQGAAALKGRLAALRGIGAAVRKRGQVQAASTPGDKAKTWRLMSPPRGPQISPARSTPPQPG